MALIINQITTWLAAPQGSLLYSAVLGLSALSTLVAAWYASGGQKSVERQRIQRTVLILFVLQVLLFLGGWLAWMEIINGHRYLPALDRTIALFSLVLVIWLWAFPNPKRWVNGLVIAFEILFVLAGISAMVWWQGQDPAMSFTTSMLGGYTYFIGLAILAVGTILLLWRRPPAWVFGLVMLVIILAGYVLQYLIPQAGGDYAWLIRLGEMLGYPFLLALPRRLVATGRSAISTFADMPATATGSVLDEKLIKAIIDLCDEKNPEQYYLKLTRLVAQLMHADVCLLVMPPKVGGQLSIPMGYNLRDDWEIDGFTVDGFKMPSLLDALHTGKSLQLDGNAPDSEVQTLTNELTLGRAAHLLEVPFIPRGVSAPMGLLVLSAPWHPLWTESDASRLIHLLNTLLSNVSQPERKVSQISEPAETTEALQSAHAETEELRQEYDQLKTEYDQLATQIKGPITLPYEGVSLVEQITSLQDKVSQLEARNSELQSLVNRGRPTAEEVEQLRQELRAALADLARIPTTLSKSDQKMLELQLSAVKRLDAMGPIELVNSIAQDFRQPLSSIIGYTDLLLSESAGLLGAVQRKFLERVKASTERLGMLMNELVQVLAIDGGRLDQTPSMVDIKAVIDEAVANINAQLSEKDITMQVEVHDELPPIQANKEALQQIVANLLQNACLVNPVVSEITLSAGVERKDDEPNYLLLSVTDQGGGIAKVDLPRVFARRYKLENPLIQGVGDTGVGLAIVKSLVELLKGRIWVDTELGVGSTFSVLLPMSVDKSPQTNLAKETSE